MVSELEKGSKSAVALAMGTHYRQCRVKGRLSEALGPARQQSGRKPGRNVCSLEPVCLPQPSRLQVSWSCPNRDNARMNNEAASLPEWDYVSFNSVLCSSGSTKSCDAFWWGAAEHLCVTDSQGLLQFLPSLLHLGVEVSAHSFLSPRLEVELSSTLLFWIPNNISHCL